MYKRTIFLILLLAMFTFASSALGKGMIMNENFGITEPDEIMKTIPASLDVLEAVKDEATNAVSNESNDLGISEPEENTEETASDDVEPIEATEVKSDDVKVFETSADFELTEKIEITVSADVAVKEVSEDIIDTASVESKDAKDVQVVEPVGVEEEVKLPVSQITPDEFRRMCAGASNEMILNAIKNRNADVNAKDYYDVTPLMFAAEKNSDAEVITILIASGAKPDAKDKDGKTALMYAAKSNPSSNIIIALASGYMDFIVPADIMAVGEVGLSGEVRNVSQVENRVREAVKMGFVRCIVPESSMKALGKIRNVQLNGVSNVTEAIELLRKMQK